MTRDLERLVRLLAELAPEDAAKLRRVQAGAREIVALEPPMTPPELSGFRESSGKRAVR